MKKIYFVWMFCIMLSFQASTVYAVVGIEVEKIATVFAKYGATGTCVIYDMQNNREVVYNTKRSTVLYSPASTFKIVNSLIALQEGVVSNVDDIFYRYDGSKQFLPSWEQDMNIRKAIRVSCVPAYQKLARSIGMEGMKKNIAKLQYGNGIIGKEVDTFWLDNTMKISAIQQVHFLTRLATRALPYSKKNQKQVHEISLLEQGATWKLYGKTGWFTKETPSIGWFVGWVETNGALYIFALNMDIENSTQLPQRELIMKRILSDAGIL